MKVFIIVAVTADGLVGRAPDDFAMDWTSPEDVKHFVKLTKEAGVLVMGSRTFDTTVKAGRRLPGRKIVVYSSRPGNIKHNRTDPTEISSEPPAQLVKRLESEGYSAVAICGGAQIYDMFMQSGLVTDLYITYEPVLFGTGVPLFKSAMFKRLKIVDQTRTDDDVLFVHYEVQK